MSSSVLVEKASGLLVIVDDGATVIAPSGDPNTLVVSDGSQGVVADLSNASEIVVSDAGVTVIETRWNLPTETIPEEEEVYAKRVDFVNDTLIYRAEAVPGTVDSDTVWRIRRLTLASDDDVTEEWANGNASFINTWNDHLTLTYQ